MFNVILREFILYIVHLLRDVGQVLTKYVKVKVK